MQWKLSFLLIQIETDNYFSFVHFVFLPAPQMGLGWQAGTQNLPLPNRLRAGRRTKKSRTPQGFPCLCRTSQGFGRQAKIIRSSTPIVCGTKDLRVGFTFELLLWHICGAFSYCLRQYWVFQPDNKVTITGLSVRSNP